MVERLKYWESKCLIEIKFEGQRDDVFVFLRDLFFLFNGGNDKCVFQIRAHTLITPHFKRVGEGRAQKMSQYDGGRV